MREVDPALQRCPLFDGIRTEDLAAMLGCLGARKIAARKGQPIFSTNGSGI